MKMIVSIINGLSRFMYWIAGASLAGIVFLTVADVILRLFDHPILGSYDIVSILGAVVIGFAIPQTSLERGHVLMEFLIEKLPFGGQKVFHFLTRLLAIGTFLIIGWNLISYGNDLRQTGEVSMTLRWPEYPIAYGIGLCCFIECLVLASNMVFKKEGE